MLVYQRVTQVATTTPDGVAGQWWLVKPLFLRRGAASWWVMETKLVLVPNSEVYPWRTGDAIYSREGSAVLVGSLVHTFQMGYTVYIPRDLFEHENNDDNPLELYQKLGIFCAEHEILTAQKWGGTQSSVLSGGHHGIEAGVQNKNIFSSRISWYPTCIFFCGQRKGYMDGFWYHPSKKFEKEATSPWFWRLILDHHFCFKS